MTALEFDAVPPGPYADDAEIKDDVQADIVVFELRAVKNDVQLVLIPVGMSGFAVDVAADADDD